MASHPALAVSPASQLRRERGVWNLIRSLERIASLIALVLLSPLLLMIAAVIFVMSRGTPLVAHLRAGQFGVPFWTLKFRTMWPADKSCGFPASMIEYVIDDSGVDYKNADDPRVTSDFARFCRRFSIDELPQLLHVVRGEMSLVGPRPLTDFELKTYYGCDAAEILLEKPGITGLWQVMGRSRLTYEQRHDLDLFLVRNCSIKLYFTILMRTVPVVLKGSDSW